MPKYLVETIATVRRQYEVDASDEKDALVKSCDGAGVEIHDEDVTEEVTSVQLMPE